MLVVVLVFVKAGDWSFLIESNSWPQAPGYEKVLIDS